MSLQTSRFGYKKTCSRRSEAGQVVVEYVLILVVLVGFAAVIIKTLVSRDKNNAGAVVKVWNSTLVTIGEDKMN